MIPWNGCGAYQAAALGVATWEFAPYAFMNLVNPVYAIIISYLGIGVRYKDDSLNKKNKKNKNKAIEKKEEE